MEGRFRQDPEDIQVLSFLNEQQVDYVYVGPKGIHQRQPFPTEPLERSSFYQTVYDRPQVKVFAFAGATVGTPWSADFGSQPWEFEGLSPQFVNQSLVLRSRPATPSTASLDLSGLDLQLEEGVWWLEVQWRTEEDAILSLDIQVENMTHGLVGGVTSEHLAIWKFKVSNLGPGALTSLVLHSSGDGRSIISRLVLHQALPVNTA